MSISTRGGDGGETGLMFGRRVAKTHARVEACGSVDELNAAIGVARTATRHEGIGAALREIQADLVTLMGELATLEADHERYLESGHRLTGPDMVDGLTARVDAIEEDLKVRFRDWAYPGESASPASAHLDLSRAVCRRAERRVMALLESKEVDNRELLRYLNRLSDYLWLLARREDALDAQK